MVVNARMSNRKYRLFFEPRAITQNAPAPSPRLSCDTAAIVMETATAGERAAQAALSSLATDDLAALDPQALQQRLLEEARCQSMRQGYEEGQRQAREELAAALRAVQQAVAQATERSAEFLTEAEAMMPDVAIEIARKVIQIEVSTNMEVVKTAVRKALAQMKDADLTLKLNPEDARVVRAHLPELAQVAEHGTFVRLIEDPRIERGGCLVESLQGEIDAQPSSKLQQIRRSLSNG